MNRRRFVTVSGAAAAASLTSMPVAAATPGRALMKLGCQSAPTNDTHLKYLARYGVRNICGYPEIAGDRIYATVDELKQMRDLAEKNGITVDCTAPPFLESSHIDKEKHPAIMLAESPQRDRDIESLQTMIKNCAAAGIPSIKYNMSLLGVIRTERTPGRGDARYSTWRLKEAHPSTPLTRAGKVLVAIRDSETRVLFSGYSPAAYKLFVFVVSAALAGIAGALYAPQVGIITPAKIGVLPSIEMVVWVAAGGRGTLYGAVLGAFGVNWIQSWLTTSYPDLWLLFLGGLFMGAVLFFPDGIVGALGRLGARVRRIVSRRPDPAVSTPSVSLGRPTP